MCVFLYCFREREVILNLFEEISGARLTPCYIRIGGVAMDLPAARGRRSPSSSRIFPDRINEYWTLLDENQIWRDRTVGVGMLDAGGLPGVGHDGPGRCGPRACRTTCGK